MSGDNKDSISCHQVAVRDASMSQVISHHFGIKDFIKDITLEKMFRMFKMILVNKHFFQANYDDQQWGASRRWNVLHNLAKGTVNKGDHYVVPLLFQDKNLVIPNNSIQALRRLKFLKRQLLRDKVFSRIIKNSWMTS